MGTPLAGKSGAFWTSVTDTNLLTNPGFEAGSMTGWTNGTISSSDPYDGKYAASVTDETLSQATGAATVAADDYISVRCVAKASGTPSATGTLKLDFLDAGSVSVGSVAATIPIATSAWTHFSLIHKAPASTDHVEISITAGTGDTYYVDAFQVYKLEQVGGFYSWSLDAAIDTAEVTAFEDSGWKTFIPTLLGWTGRADHYWGTEEFFNHIANERNLYAVFYVEQDSDMTGKRWEGLVYVQGASISAAVADVISESITLQGDGPLSYIED